MGFLEGVLVRVVTGLLEKLGAWLFERAKKSKVHEDERADLRKKAQRVKNSAERVKKSIEENKRVTEELAHELKERNRKLRSGGMFT